MRKRSEIAAKARTKAPATFVWFIACLLILVLQTNLAISQEDAGQESGVGPETEQISTATIDLSGSVVEEEGIGTIKKSASLVRVESNADQQIPILKVQGSYFDPSGMCATGTLSDQSSQVIKSDMLRDSEMGFRTFMLRVDWPGIQPDQNRIDSSRIEDLLSYAADLGMKVIISLELNRAPSWFFQGASGSGRVMVSYLVDPEMEKSLGNDGILRWSNGTGIPIMYNPDTVRAVGKLIYSLYYSIKDQKAFLGWYVSGPVTMAFPGGGRDGVWGMCDYSPYSVNKYVEATGTPFMAYPLPRYTQGTRDSRPDFRAFTNQRLTWKREAFDQIINELRDVDKDHLVLVGMDPVLNYRDDNGYLSEIQAPDATRQLLFAGVDGAVVAFRLSKKTFDALPYNTESSAMHLALTINQIVRNGKLAIVLVESDSANPANSQDICQLAYMIKAAGAYPLWCSGFLQKRGHRWSWEQRTAIEKTQPMSLLPPPKRLRRGQVAILDLPKFYSSYYAEQNKSLGLSLLQLAMHQRTGVILEVVGSDELSFQKAVLSSYTNVIYLSPELTTNAEAKAWIDPGTQLELASFRVNGGVIEAVDPMLLNQYELEGYRSPVLEDELRTRYVHRGAAADLLHGADAFIVANEPYIFIRVNKLYGAKYIDVKLGGWPQNAMSSINVIDVPTTASRNVEVISGSASFRFSPENDTAHLFLLNDDYEPIARLYENRQTSVTMAQQSRNMHRSVPAALLFAAFLAVALVWMSFQAHRKSLLQAAELEDHKLTVEPLDILDDAEVMAFYKKYLSGQEAQEKEDKKRD